MSLHTREHEVPRFLVQSLLKNDLISHGWLPVSRYKEIEDDFGSYYQPDEQVDGVIMREGSMRGPPFAAAGLPRLAGPAVTMPSARPRRTFGRPSSSTAALPRTSDPCWACWTGQTSGW